jgi:hypothetical protein
MPQANTLATFCTIIIIIFTHVVVDPSHVIGHFSVDSRSVSPGASVTVTRDPLQNPFTVRFGTHQGTPGVSQTSIPPSAFVPSAEHIIGDFVKRKKDGALPTLDRRYHRNKNLLQSIGCNREITACSHQNDDTHGIFAQLRRADPNLQPYIIYHPRQVDPEGVDKLVGRNR